MQDIIQISTHNQNGLYDNTSLVRVSIRKSGVSNGLVSMYVQGATAAIMTQENWDQSVQNDVITLLRKLIPSGVLGT